MLPGSDMPRVLVLASTYPRWSGDPEPGFVHELAKRLRQHFYVVVLCPHAKGAKTREVMDGVEVIRYRYAPQRLETLVNDGGIVTNLRNSPWKWLLVLPFVLAQALAMWSICRRNSIHAIHAHWLIPQGLVAAAMLALTKRSMPFVVTSHGADLFALNGRALNFIKRYVIQSAASVTVVSHAMIDQIRAIGAVARQVDVIPMGVDLAQRFSVAPMVSRSPYEILFVGRLVEKKGVQHLISAMPLVLEQYPDARLQIVGFGPLDKDLRSQVERLNLSASVHFLGAVTQSELPDLYRRAAVFVAPFVKVASGDQEGLPVALMEAVACGCPVVAGDVAGIEDLLGEMKGEVCVDVRDSQALASKICQNLADAVTARDRAARILATAGQHVDWNRISARYAKVIQRVIAQEAS